MIAKVRPGSSHQFNAKRSARIALLGCGTVGREVAIQIHRYGKERGLELGAILVREPMRDRGLPPELFTSDFDDVLAKRPDLAIEAIGGLEPPAALAVRTLSAGIPLVTANKTLIAHCGPELERIAQRCRVGLAYEAAVCSGVPVLAALRQLHGDRIVRLRAVVNGTCNFILTEMERGLPFGDALASAQRLGYAEADPTADISGRDSAEKLCILARAAGWTDVRPESVDCHGIEDITPEDLADARQSRHTVRLVAEMDAATGQLSVRPALVARNQPLARASGPDNAVVITTQLAGDIVLAGAGAGARATASAILSDAAQLLRFPLPGPVRAATIEPREGNHYIRVSQCNAAPDPVLALLAEHKASPVELTFARDRISTIVSLGEGAARACASKLATPEGQTLVMPVLK